MDEENIWTRRIYGRGEYMDEESIWTMRMILE